MVNYKRMVCEAVLVLCLAGVIKAAPAADCLDRHHYDQRQNGSENYRLNIDGVVIAVAPAETLLSAASELDFGDLLDVNDLNELRPKPPTGNKPLFGDKPDPKPEEKPQDSTDSKPELSDVSMPSDPKGQRKDGHFRKQEKAQRLKMRLANMLIPLLRRVHHH